MRTKSRSKFAIPVELVQPQSYGITLLAVNHPGTFTTRYLHDMASFSAWLMRKTGKRRKKRANSGNTEHYTSDTKKDHVEVSTVMAQANGIYREATPVDTNIVPPGRVISTSMMRQGAHASFSPKDRSLTVYSNTRADTTTRHNTMVLRGWSRKYRKIRSSHRKITAGN